MNFNENKLYRGKGKALAQNKSKVGIKPLMIPINKRKTSKESSSSSKINWGITEQTICNSSVLHSTRSTSKEENTTVIVAITEGRGDARCEVGIAAICITRPHLILCQISDYQNYINTLTKINILNPTQILVPMTFVDTANRNRLIETMKNQFPHIKLISVPRNTYNKANGMEIIQELCVPSLNSILLVLQYKYYALSAASALLKYIQNNLHIYYASGSIKIDYEGSEGFTIIDVSTADRLELVSCAKPLQGNKYSTLFGMLNHCYTKIGARMLRSTLLQPPYAINLIEEKFDCVTELRNQPEKLLCIQAILQKVSNIDQLLTLPTIVPDDSQHCSNRQLNYMLLLNKLVDLLEPLENVLQHFDQPFFQQLCNTLVSCEFISIKNKVRNFLHENAYAAQGHNGLLQRCFAVKPGLNGLLDVVRKTFSERLEDMREYVHSLGERYNLPLTVGNNNTKGYHIVLTLNKQQRLFMRKSDIPKEFMQVCRLAGSFTMKTPQLINLSTRIQDIITDILKISNVMIFKTLMQFKQFMSLFYTLCEEIAQLDMLQSLSQASTANFSTRPSFSDFTNVLNSYHPMLDFSRSDSAVPNSITASKDFNLHIITGPNGSGKSIFIRQIMLLQIMAQIGCYVPAKSATFRPADRMVARVYLEDNMECGVSSFTLEMKEVSYILNTMTDNSLVIIDELCRSTSVQQGAALAMTLCEYLSSRSSFVFVTTHFTIMTKLRDLYLNIKTWHLETTASGDSPRTMKLDYKHNVLPGVTKLKQYGIYLVQQIWPKSIVDDAYDVLEKCTRLPQNANTSKTDDRVRIKYELESNLKKLKSQGKCTHSQINKLINKYFSDLEKLGVVHPSGNVKNNQLASNTISEADETLSSFLMANEDDFLFENMDVDNIINDSMAEEQMHTPNISQNYNLQQDQIDYAANASYYSDFLQTSSYKRLSNFINQHPKNVELLIPNINMSLPSDEAFHNEISDRYDNNVDPSFLEKKQNTPDKHFSISFNPNNIQQSVFPNQMNDSSEGIFWGEEQCHPSFPTEKDIESGIDYGEDLEEDINAFNRSLMMEINQHNKKESENLLNYPTDGIYSHMPASFDQGIDQQFPQFGEYQSTSQISQSQFELHQSAPEDFLFVKPTSSKVFKKRIDAREMDGKSSKIIEDADVSRSSLDSNILTEFNHMQFSLPLIGNTQKTSTPIVHHRDNICPNTIFYKNNRPDGLWEIEENCDEGFRRVAISAKEDCVDDAESLIAPFENDGIEVTQHHEHLFPSVRIVEGPDNKILSFGEEDVIGKSHILNPNKRVVLSKSISPGVDETLESFIEEEVSIFLSEIHDNDFANDYMDLTKSIDESRGKILTDISKPDNVGNVGNNSFEEIVDKVQNENNGDERKLSDQKIDTLTHNCEVDSTDHILSKDCEVNTSEKNEDSDHILSKEAEDVPIATKSGMDKTCNSSRQESPLIFENVTNITISSQNVEMKNLSEGFATSGSSKAIDEKGESQLRHRSSSDPNQSGNFDDSLDIVGCSISSEENIFNSMISNKRIMSGKDGNFKRIGIENSLKEVGPELKSTRYCQESNGEDIIQISCKNHTVDGNILHNVNSKPDEIRTQEISNECNRSSGSKISYGMETKENAEITECNITGNGIENLTKLHTAQELFDSSLSAASRLRNIDNTTSTSTNSNDKNDKTTTSGRDIETNTSADFSSSKRKIIEVDGPNKRIKAIENLRAVKNVPKRKHKGITTDGNVLLYTKGLSKLQIEDDFRKQDEKLLSVSNDVSSDSYSKYLESILRRPSVKQIQNAQQIALARRTDDGVVIIPAKNKPQKRSSNNKKRTNMGLSLNKFVDVSIFSDKNAQKMEAFLNSDEKDYHSFKFQPTDFSFKGIASQTVQGARSPRSSGLFKRSRSFAEYTFRDFTNVSRCTQFSSLGKNCKLVSSSTSQFLVSQRNLTPDGYYKQNKNEIENIVGKYICRSQAVLLRRNKSFSVDPAYGFDYL